MLVCRFLRTPSIIPPDEIVPWGRWIFSSGHLESGKVNSAVASRHLESIRASKGATAQVGSGLPSCSSTSEDVSEGHFYDHSVLSVAESDRRRSYSLVTSPYIEFLLVKRHPLIIISWWILTKHPRTLTVLSALFMIISSWRWSIIIIRCRCWHLLSCKSKVLLGSWLETIRHSHRIRIWVLV